MKITKIVQQQSSKGRVSVYIDGRYRLSLNQDQLLETGLRSGEELSEADIARLHELSELGKALAQAYNYLSYRSRSKQEIKQHLKGKKWETEVIDSVINRLEQLGHLDDTQFARDWVENRQLSSPRSKRQLKAELWEKGIAPEIIEAALEPLTETVEIQMISQLITTKRLRQRYSDERKLINHLAGKGFSYGSIKQALESAPK